MDSAQTSEELKSCCAISYESDLAKSLLGESYHPGGLDLSRSMAKTANIKSGSRVLDIACGIGTTSLMLANEFGATVTGIDYGHENVATAKSRAADLGVTAEFVQGDAERLLVESASVDFVFCECAYCTFPSKEAAACEFARVLTPGGVLCLSDVVMDHEQAPESLRSFAAWVSCLADARTAEQYESYLNDAGLEVFLVERHDNAMLTMIDDIANRLQALKMLGTLGADFDYKNAENLIKDSKQAVHEGYAGYVSVFAKLAK